MTIRETHHNNINKITSVILSLWYKWESFIGKCLKALLSLATLRELNRYNVDYNKASNPISLISTAFRRRKVLLFSLLVLIITLPILYLTFKYQPETEAAWFNDSWAYRQTVNITNAGSAQTDYQVNLSIGSSALIVSGKMQSDCDDVRITDINGKILPHWIESSGNSCNSVGNSTTIWTKAPSIPTSGTTLYIYYGNPSATNAEDLNKIFDTNISQSWEFSSTTESWGDSLQQMTTPTAANGIWSSTYSAASDPFFRSPSGLTITASTTKYVFFKIRVTNGQASPQLFWITNLDGTETEAKSVSKTWTYNGNWQILAFNVGADGDWANTVTRLRLDPVASGTGNVDIDWVRIHNSGSSYPSVAAPTNEENSPGPVAYWKFDEGQGTNAQDSTSTNNDGTITGATWQTEEKCISGKCLYLDNNGDSIQYANNPINQNTWTIEMWFNVKDVDQYDMLYSGADNADIQLFFHQTSKYLTTSVENTERTTSFRISDHYNEWHHVVWTHSGSNQSIVYIDGNVVLDTTDTSYTNSGNTIYVGRVSGGSYNINGFIDEVKIYNYARSAAQAKADYNQGKAVSGSVKGTSASLGSKPQQYLSEGLVGYWKLDESSGTSASDSSGVGNTAALGTGTSSPSWATGKYGNGMSFDGNDYASVVNSSSITGISSKGTISLWVKLNSVPSGGNMATLIDVDGTGCSARGLDYYLTSTSFALQYGIGSCVNINSTTTPSTGTWYHLVATWDRTTGAKMYVNGNLEDTDTSLPTFDIAQASSYIGAQTGTLRFLDGIIDDLRIYNRALSGREISDLYNWAPGPVGYWKFDEKTGTTAYDSSGNGNNTSSWSGTPVWGQGKYGGGLSFDGSSNLQVDANANFNVRALTIEGWIKTPTSMGGVVYKALFSKQGADRDYNFYTYSSDGTKVTSLHFSSARWTTGNPLQSLPTAFDPNTWHHVAVTVDASNLRFYADGVNFYTTSSTDSNANNSYNVWIARADNYWNSLMDDVKFYNYARTAKQIVEDMNAGHPAVGSPVGSALLHLKFDEGVGSTAYNSGSQGSTLNASLGSSSSAPSWTMNGKFGKALSFDGTNDYISISSDPLGTNYTDYTISAWIKTSYSAAIQGIFQRVNTGNDTSVASQFRIAAAGQLQVDDYNPSSGGFTGTATVNDGNWHHIISSRSGSTRYLYVDGKLDNTQTSAESYSGSAPNKIYIGMDNRSSTFSQLPFNGLIDEVKLYNYALTADEVKLDYNRGSSMVLGALSQGSGSTAPATADSQEYCIPGDSTSCAAPIALWKFEEGVGSTAFDTSGSGLNGTWAGTPNWVSGKNGRAVKFDGSTTRITSADTGLPTGSSARTAEAWIKTTTKANYGVIFRYGTESSTNLFWFATDSSGNIIVTQYGASYTSSGVDVADGNWHHIAVTQTGNSYLTYIDGVQRGNGSMTTNTTLTGTASIGDSYTESSRKFTGTIDEVRFFNYVRTPTQIVWDYSRGAPIAHWKFDEGQGTTVYNSIGTGNTGVLTVGSAGTQSSAGTITTASTAWGNGVTGKKNYSLSFDGTDDYIGLGDIFDSQFAGADKKFSLSVWVKPAAAMTNNIVIGKSGDSNCSLDQREYVLNLYTGSKPQFFWTNLAGTAYRGVSGSSAITDTSQWYHITAVYDGSIDTNDGQDRVTMYVNGKSEGTTVSLTTGTLADSDIQDGTAHLGIGKNLNASGANCGSSNYFNGQIDDVKVYNYALTPTQVKDIYNNGAINFAPATGAP